MLADVASVVAQAVFGLYLVFVLLVGVYASRFTERTPSDFYVADRTIGTVLLGLTLVATVLSAFTVFGIGAATTGAGLGIFSFLAIAAVFYTVVFGTVGVTLFRIGTAMDVVTPSEYVSERYDSPLLAVVYLAVTAVFMVAMIAGQLIGGGVALDALLGIPYIQAVLAMAVFMVLYLHLAGYRGVVWSDAIQSTMLFGVLAGVFLYVLLFLDSGAIAAEAAATKAQLFDMVGPVGVWTPLYVITYALAFTVGVPGYPHSIQRYFSAASAATMRKSGFLFSVVAIPTYFFAAVLGAWSLGVIPVPENPDYVIPLLVQTLTNPVVFGIAMAGGTAAIMSTADSVALTMSSMVSRDVYRAFVDPDASEEREVRVTQALLVTTVALAVVLAWLRPAGIFDLVAFAVVGFATTSAPVFLGAYWERGTAAAGVASLLLGPGITILFFLETIPARFTFGMHYGFVGVVIAYAIFVVVSFLTSAPASETVTDYSRGFWEGAD